MDKVKSKFETRPIIEQKPFESPVVQAFFKKWCQINDSIESQMISRDDWERKYEDKSILEKRPDGKQNLYIPEDLQLWEMIWVMEVVDHDTFANKPERQNEAKKKLLELGEIFQNAGIYIAQRLHSIEKGREIASALAEEFYDYGRSLITGGKFEEPQGVEDIASLSLTEQETETVDRFLAGDDLYKTRQARVENESKTDPDKKDEIYETERQKALAQFFRVAEKAFEMEGKSKGGELQKNKAHLEPWQRDTPLHSAFIAKVEKALKQKIEIPKRELEGSIFRRGMELLQKNMPFDKLPDWVKYSYLHWQNGEKTLREALQIDKLKTELEMIRQSGDIAEISAKERDIADKIQRAVSHFSYKRPASNPSEMLANQYINCVGASILGGALMQEAGLTFLVGGVPEHSILFLVTSEGQIEWRDMLASAFNEDLTDEMILGNKRDGSPLTIEDIVAFSKNPISQSLTFDIKSNKYRDKLKWVQEGERQYVTVFGPEHGQQIQLLQNLGAAFEKIGHHQEAIEVFRQSIALDSRYAISYYNLGVAFEKLERYQEAIEVFRQSIALDSRSSLFYSGLGFVFEKLGRYQEAFETYRQSIAVDPKHLFSYYGLGNAFKSLERYQEAIEAYQKFIDLADEQYAILIKIAEGTIILLKNIILLSKIKKENIIKK